LVTLDEVLDPYVLRDEIELGSEPEPKAPPSPSYRPVYGPNVRKCKYAEIIAMELKWKQWKGFTRLHTYMFYFM
jgi:hypothetical protein